MPSSRYPAPVWLKGLSNSTFGLYGGFVTFTLPQLLAAEHVPEARLTALCVAATSPVFWAFVLGPMLDVRFSRRFYATFFTVLSGLSMIAAVLCSAKPVALTVLSTIGFAAAAVVQNAVGGWLSTITQKDEENSLSAWFTVANLGGCSVMALIGAEAIAHLPLLAAGVLLGAMLQIPALIFLWMPAPGPDRRLARESFGGFFREILGLFKRREVVIALVLLLSPAASFSLTNLLGGVGADFHASPRLVSLLGGAFIGLAGVAGSLLLPVFAKKLALRPLYLAIGGTGALFTLALILLPHTPWSFALALVGENVFQSLAITCSVAIVFETIGRNNPLAATTFSFLLAAYGLPLEWMLLVDGRAYSHGGVAASYAADGALGLAACLLLGLMLAYVRRGSTKVEEVELEAAS
jgi:PAT family beta-lactamase induction signal transducer AmpG